MIQDTDASDARPADAAPNCHSALASATLTVTLATLNASLWNLRTPRTSSPNHNPNAPMKTAQCVGKSSTTATKTAHDMLAVTAAPGREARRRTLNCSAAATMTTKSSA